MKLINHISSAANWTASKTGAALKLGAGVTGDIVGTAAGVVGGTLAVTGGIVAAVGFGTYAGGMAIMGASENLSVRSQDMADKAYDDLFGKKDDVGQEIPDGPAYEEFPPALATG